MEQYRLDKAARPINDLLDDLSNWYVRRSRRRFWKSQDDLDKQQAYLTLHYSLIVSCQLLAPFSPFLSDYIWRKLTQNTKLPTSVHLTDWPVSGDYDNDLITQMDFLRESLTIALAQRASAGIKVRQPLSKVTIYDENSILNNNNHELNQLIAEELNVKEVEVLQSVPVSDDSRVVLNIEIDEKLRGEGLVREVIRFIQNARKQAGLNVDDRIKLNLNTEDKQLNNAIKEHGDLIKTETLAVKINENQMGAESFKTLTNVDKIELEIELEKS
jgi:isoleucyl-tRNA synthetase